jgi:iron complex transport system ATP-binding protein
VKLEVSQLSVRFGTFMALRDISFTAAAGELICVLGPNGAGKTTLLRALAGLVEFEGRVVLSAADLATLAPRERAQRIAYLPQGHVAYWPLTAREIVTLGRLPHASSLSRLAPADQEAIERALAHVDAARVAARPVTKLSGGERARVMLARALAVEAPLLLADEPVAALDAQHQLATLALLQDLARAGRCILAAVHDLALVSRFASRVLVLHEGQLVANGPPAQVLNAELLQTVFGITTLAMEHEGAHILLPWSTVGRAR